jgi:hypothetical protein
MKHAHLLSLFAAATEAAVLNVAADTFYPGIQFDSDRKLSISVFSDLHLGEREFSHCFALAMSTDNLQPTIKRQTSRL